MTEAIKKQKECIIKFGDLQSNRNNFSVGHDHLNEEEKEMTNKLKVCEYFQILKGLDTYVGPESKYKIKYGGRYLEDQQSPKKL